MFIEQAIFTSCRTDRLDGYQLAATSAGVTPGQAEELTAWGPAHDSLLDPTSRAGSVNFHCLAEGAFCISKTVPAGAEYSGRQGPRVFTTFLLVGHELMNQFAFQPFRILDAAIAAGHARVMRRIPDALPSIPLRGRASASLAMLLEPLADASCRRNVIRLISAAVQGPLLVRSRENLRMWFDRLLNAVPVECRSELAFSTGLRYSPQRAFRMMPAPVDSMEAEHAARQLGGSLVDLESEEGPPSAVGEWSQNIEELLALGRTDELLAELHQPRPGLTLASLESANAVASA